jgi:hypothetical protein
VSGNYGEKSGVGLRGRFPLRLEPEGLAVVGPGVHEVVAPDVIPARSPEPDAGTVVQPQVTAFSLFLRHFQSFPPPQSLDSFVIHFPALPVK